MIKKQFRTSKNTEEVVYNTESGFVTLFDYCVVKKAIVKRWLKAIDDLRNKKSINMPLTYTILRGYLNPRFRSAISKPKIRK